MAKRMKIAFLNIYNGVIDRGAETFVKEIAQRLAKKHEVFVFQAGARQGFEKYKVVRIPIKFDWSRKSGAGTLPAFFFVDYRNRMVALFTLKSLPRIWKGRFDVVVPVNGGWMPAIVRLVTWFYRRKMVISGQSGIGWDDRNNLWAFPNVFVALSTRAKKWAKRANPFVRVEYIPNGVDAKRLKPQGEKLKTNLKRPIILCVGALTPSKRIDLVIKAVARVKDASLLVVGDGDLRDEIKSLGKRLLGRRFQLLKLPFEKMPRVYRTADLFSLVSAPYYSFEVVLVEAMASGLGVVVNDDPIRREIVGKAGLFVKPENSADFARALEKALKTRWGDKPRRQAEKFSWDRIARDYESLLKSLFK